MIMNAIVVQYSARFLFLYLLLFPPILAFPFIPTRLHTLPSGEEAADS